MDVERLCLLDYSDACVGYLAASPKQIELQHCQETIEMFEQNQHIKVDNVMHAVKIRRTGNSHADRAKTTRSKVKVEAIRINRETKFKKTNDIKQITRCIEDPLPRNRSPALSGTGTPNMGVKRADRLQSKRCRCRRPKGVEESPCRGCAMR